MLSLSSVCGSRTPGIPMSMSSPHLPRASVVVAQLGADPRRGRQAEQRRRVAQPQQLQKPRLGRSDELAAGLQVLQAKDQGFGKRPSAGLAAARTCAVDGGHPDGLQNLDYQNLAVKCQIRGRTGPAEILPQNSIVKAGTSRGPVVASACFAQSSPLEADVPDGQGRVASRATARGSSAPRASRPGSCWSSCSSRAG